MESMTSYLIDYDEVIEDFEVQLKAIEEFESKGNNANQFQDTPKIDEVLEILEDIFDNSCQASLFSSPHFEAIDIAKDLSVEEDRAMDENISRKGFVEESQEFQNCSSIHDNQLETSSLDKELLALLNLVVALIRRLQIGYILPTFGDWFTSRRNKYAFLFGENNEKGESVNFVFMNLYDILMFCFYLKGRAIPMHGRRPLELRKDYFSFIGIECNNEVRQASDVKQVKV